MAQPHAGPGKGYRPSQLLGTGKTAQDVGRKVEYQSRNTRADAIHISSRSRRASVNCKRRRAGSRPTWRSCWKDQILCLGLMLLNHKNRITPTTTTNKIINFMGVALDYGPKSPSLTRGHSPCFVLNCAFDALLPSLAAVPYAARTAVTASGRRATTAVQLRQLKTIHLEPDAALTQHCVQGGLQVRVAHLL